MKRRGKQQCLTDVLDAHTLRQWEIGFAAVVDVPAYFLTLDHHLITLHEQVDTDDSAMKAEAEAEAEAVTESPLSQVGTISKWAYEVQVTLAGQICGYLAIATEDITGMAEEALTRVRRLQHFTAQSMSLFLNQEDQLQLRAQQMTTLFELSTLLSDQSDINQMLTHSLRALEKVLNVSAGSVRLLGADGTHLQTRAMMNLSEHYVQTEPMSMDSSPLVHEAVENRNVVVSESLSDPRRLNNPDIPDEEKFESLLISPILNGMELIGAVLLYDRRQRNYDSYEKQLVLSVGQVIGAAVSSARQRQQERQRYREMAALNRLSRLLTRRRDLQSLLTVITEETARVFNSKASSIRLLDGAGQLEPKAVYGLSDEFLLKGSIFVERSQIDRAALAGEVVYVEDMANDARVLYPEDAKKEGITSVLAAGMVYNGRPIGAMRIYDEDLRKYTDTEMNLLQSLAQLAAGAIENARLDGIRQEARRVQHQVALAGEIQKRLMPETPPQMSSFDLAGRYEPCFEMGGDFFDYISTDRSLGIMLGDAVGKGVPAAMLATSVRASVRAYVEDVYDIDEVIHRVNNAVHADTESDEFVTLFYGWLDAVTLRMTYVSAGHDPVILFRDGQTVMLEEGGFPIGIVPDTIYEKGIVDLQPEDILVFYSDGVPDAVSFGGMRFGRERIAKEVAAVSEYSARQIMDHLLWQIRRFVGMNQIQDDMTLVVVKVKEAMEIMDAESMLLA